MAQQICKNCRKLLEGGDLVKAEIITKFVALKSSVTYALEQPQECRSVVHVNCQYPKTGEKEGD